MSLTLNHRWEHALLAETVAHAKQKCSSCTLGRTAIQKLLYFMKVLGVPMRYDFDIHHFGPFSPEVMDDMEWLIADEVIEDCSHEARYSNYKPGPAWSDLRAQFEESLSTQQGRIASVCNALSDFSPNELELIATLDFSFRWVRAKGGPGPWKSAAIDKFKAIKKEKFTDQEIDRWYATLVEARLIEP